MLEHIQSIAIGSHPIFIGLVIDLLNNVFKSFLNVIPCRVKIIHVYLQMVIVHLAQTDALRLLCLEILEMVLPHSLDYLAQRVVEPME